MKKVYSLLFLVIDWLYKQLMPLGNAAQNTWAPRNQLQCKITDNPNSSPVSTFSKMVNILLPHSNTTYMNLLVTRLNARVNASPAFIAKAVCLLLTTFLLSSTSFATYGDVGDFVWRDTNCDGIQQSGEQGIAGVKVTLTYPNGTTTATTTTNSSGHYSFNNLQAGNYVIAFTTPSGYTPSPSDRGNDFTRDSDPVNGKVSVTVYAGENNPCIDAGFCGPVANNNNAVGNFVWSDRDCDGLQDSGEPGIGGVKVTLTFPNGTTTLTTTTDNNGNYIFTNLAPGNYVISFTTPAGYTASPSNVGNDFTRDSDPVNGKLTITVYSGEDNTCIDAGYCSPVNNNNSVGNFVWRDLDCDGIQDAGEPGLAGVQVTLTYPNGTTTASTITNSSGNYLFSNLPPGKYMISFVTPAGYTASPADRGNDVTKDSDPVNGKVTVDVYANEDNPCIDAGFCGPNNNSILGDFVWRDLDCDGIQDAGEPGIAGVVVTLTFPDGVTTATATTNALGIYQFTNLAPGNYVVSFATPAGYTPSPSDRGNDVTKDSDPVNGKVAVTVYADETNPCIDAGYCGPYNYNNAVGDFVWRDMDCDGIQDAGEMGIAGVKVALTTTSGAPVANTVTDANGFYKFTNIAPGNYIVVFTTPDGYTPSPADRGGDVTKDSDPVNGKVNITVYANEDNPCIDAGYCGPVANSLIGDFVWNDLNRNGIQDAGEPGFAGVIVRLTNSSNVVTTTTTSATGYYEFSNLPPGTYTVCFTTPIPTAYLPSPANQGGDDTKDSDPVGGCVTVVLGANDINRTIDAGFYDDIDDDDDGITDLDESGGFDPLKDCDNDGIPNYKDQTPGCPGLTFTDCPGLSGMPDGINDFFDFDKDGIINELDLDSDNDGILDIKETRDTKATDTNSDGMADGTDVDGDGLFSSADGTPNVWGGPGLLAQDLDRDGLPNYLDLDSDGDGISDLTEATRMFDNDGLVNGADTDGDGVKDLADGITGKGAIGIGIFDSDNDGKPNPYDIDSDNDGITDNVEGQPTCSEAQPTGSDSDKDGLDNAYDVDNNICIPRGGGITPYDKDNDGTPDIYDLDTDNDLAPDVNEGSGIPGNFVTNFADTDGDGLIDQFDIYNIKTGVTEYWRNVVHSNMGPNGSFNGPIPAGSSASVQGFTCPSDRDWRNVTILPITLLEFKGNLNAGNIKLTWTVANEINMSHYIVERSLNGTTFSEAGKVNALGNITNTGYDLTDNVSNFTGNVYYRLKQVDKNGGIKYSNVLVFKLNGKSVNALVVNPNPAKSFFVLKLSAAKDGVASIRIIDMVGKVMTTEIHRISAGSNAISFNELGKYASGTYTIQVILDGEVMNGKLLVSK